MNWLEITDAPQAKHIYKQLADEIPYEDHSSLHVWEKRYILGGNIYRLFIVMSQPDYWTLEVLHNE